MGGNMSSPTASDAPKPKAPPEAPPEAPTATETPTATEAPKPKAPIAAAVQTTNKPQNSSKQLTDNAAPMPNKFKNMFNKKDVKKTFTTDYGTSVNMISFIGSVYSRLAYMNEHQFLGHYTKIFGPIIPYELMKNMNDTIKTGTPNILNDEKMFSLKKGGNKFGLDTYETTNGTSLRFLPWAQKINQVNGEQRIDAKTSNCDIETTTTQNNNLVFATIATSNYGTTYVVGDTRMPNIVNVIFRGTSDAKSAGSYSKASSLTAMWTGNIISGLEKEEDKEKFLYGIYKILIETTHSLVGAIKYVSNKINPTAEKGSVNVITTGHSLGGGLATIFAYVYVAHISNQKNFTNLYPSLNVNIGCFTYGSPRVLSKDLATHFCELTTNNKNNFLNYQHNESYKNFISSINSVILGRITYLRIVMHNDPVTAVPKVGYSHPCSDLGIDMRKATNVDCLVQVGNSFSNRCRGTRLAMTYDFDLPLNCVNTKEDRKNGPKGPLLAKMPMGYHTEYLGISYIGGISLGNVFGKNIKRVQESINERKKGDTVCRILIYPSENDSSKASVGFYDLSIYRSKSNVASLNTRDIDIEKIESNEKSLDDGITKEQDINKNQNTSSTIFKNMTGISKIMVEVPEDIMITNDAFKEIVNRSGIYDIINDLTPPLDGAFIVITGNSKAMSFEGTKGGKKSRRKRKTKKLRKKHTQYSRRRK